jgi:hypothetical protein
VTVSTFGVDYSTGPPTIQELKNAKVTFVGRYVSTPGHPKNLKPAEAERLSEAGIDIVVFFQHGREFMISDRDSGARDARSALAQGRGCGMPEDRPIYFALDTDPRPLTARQWDAVFAYLDGAAAELGRDNVGIYGGRLAIDKALGAGKARWGWQTKSWSDGVWSDRAHVRQFEHDLPLGSGQVDKNRAMTDDFGQWKVGDDMPLNDADKNWLKQEICDAINDHADDLFRWADHGGTTPTVSPPNHPHSHKAILDRLDQLEKRLPS